MNPHFFANGAPFFTVSKNKTINIDSATSIKPTEEAKAKLIKSRVLALVFLYM